MVKAVIIKTFTPVAMVQSGVSVHSPENVQVTFELFCTGIIRNRQLYSNVELTGCFWAVDGLSRWIGTEYFHVDTIIGSSVVRYCLAVYVINHW